MIIFLGLDITYQPNYFSMSEPGVGRFLVAFSVQGVVFILLLFAIELQCVRNLRRILTSLCRRRKQVDDVFVCLCVCVFCLATTACILSPMQK